MAIAVVLYVLGFSKVYLGGHVAGFPDLESKFKPGSVRYTSTWMITAMTLLCLRFGSNYSPSCVQLERHIQTEVSITGSMLGSLFLYVVVTSTAQSHLIHYELQVGPVNFKSCSCYVLVVLCESILLFNGLIT